jgi:hypothetical protein
MNRSAMPHANISNGSTSPTMTNWPTCWGMSGETCGLDLLKQYSLVDHQSKRVSQNLVTIARFRSMRTHSSAELLVRERSLSKCAPHSNPSLDRQRRVDLAHPSGFQSCTPRAETAIALKQIGHPTNNAWDINLQICCVLSI